LDTALRCSPMMSALRASTLREIARRTELVVDHADATQARHWSQDGR